MDAPSNGMIEFRPDGRTDVQPVELQVIAKLSSSNTTSVFLVSDGDMTKRLVLKTYGAVSDPDLDLPQRPWEREVSVLEQLAEVRLPARPSPFPQLVDQGQVGSEPAILRSYIDAPNLIEWVGGLILDAPPNVGRRFDDVMRSTAEAITALTSNSILHGDIHEKNILVDESDNAYVIDFNISKVRHIGLTSTTKLEYPKHTPDGHPLVSRSDVDANTLLNECLHIEDPFLFSLMVGRLLQHEGLGVRRIGRRRRARWQSLLRDAGDFRRVNQWAIGDLSRLVRSITSDSNATELDDLGPEGPPSIWRLVRSRLHPV